ncbi:energy transducer TonB [Spirosoma sp. KNUC1025]|uniref:energy transducer TonB n=1 Tax=Spirosoma sp. KNUC1025 TaxID=2894082 RepID=UPI00386FF0A6|nr:energy transducer TonB [Spirosoma sp. KNUC1025]
MHTHFTTYRPTFIYTLALCIGLVQSATSCLAQSSHSPDSDVYLVVEKNPEFPGGRQALYDYLQRNTQYPPAAIAAKIKGKVVTSFIVEKDGKITHIERRLGLGYGCDEEAIRVINDMPLWIPGSQSGVPLRVRYSLVVLFGMDYPKRKGD